VGHRLERAFRRRGLRLEGATIAWNAVEGAVAISAGIAAHSIALTGFGLDSSVEVFASAVAAWQLRSPTPARSRIAIRLIGACFLLIAAYVGFESLHRLAGGHHATPSLLGLVVTAASVVVMSGLGFAKLRLADRMDNEALHAEAAFSLVDAALSATVLLGLASDRVLHWWWADPAAALVVALVAAREGARGITNPPA
jgi:divalent metal cation (Fe/Co/Zn/Cd) transporter